MSSDQSDVKKKEKKPKKTPKSVTDEAMEKQDNTKKLTTKEMIIKTLSESKSRKGISLYAIKKNMKDNYNVDIEKISYLIKKNIKESVEAGIIVQTKGIGASGSFRMAPGIKQPEKTSKAPKKPKAPKETEERLEKPKKSSLKKQDDVSQPKKKVAKISEAAKNNTKESKRSKTKENPQAGTSGMKTPKKKNMVKRKSIGSIIKPPKMKPAKVK